MFQITNIYNTLSWKMNIQNFIGIEKQSLKINHNKPGINLKRKQEKTTYLTEISVPNNNLQ